MGQVIPKIVGFFLLPIYTAFLAPEDFGIVDLAMSVGAFALSVIRLGIPGAISVFYFDYKGRKDERVYISTIYIGSTVISLILGVLFLGLGYILLNDLVPGLPFYPFFILIMLSSFLNTSSDIQKRLLQVREQSGYNALLNVVSAMIGIAVAVVLVVIMNMGALGMVIATVVTSAIFYIQAQHYLRKDLVFVFDNRMFKDSLTYTLPLLPYQVIGNLAPLFGRSILSMQSSLAAVGLFGIAFKLTQPLLVFSNALGTAYSPIYFSLRTEGGSEIGQKIARAVSKIWVVSAMLFMGIYLFATPAIVLLTDARYHTADISVRILTMGFLPTVFYLIVSQEIFYQKKTKIILLINLTAAVLNIGMALVLIPILDEVGLAISSVLPLVVSAAWAFHFSNKSYKLSFEWQKMLMVSLIALAAIAGSHLLPPMPVLYYILAASLIWLIGSVLMIRAEGSLWQSIKDTLREYLG
ncbi:MAG: oligosaccharide flippase family protein [Cytophagales bacterium]|nr:oligosaccharide flippase family protein [Cytophagales bacterium]